jgi:hypothetical protein
MPQMRRQTADQQWLSQMAALPEVTVLTTNFECQKSVGNLASARCVPHLWHCCSYLVPEILKFGWLAAAP